MFLRGAALVFSVVMLFLVVFVSNLGFQEVLDFRQLERIPLSLITDSVGGESQLHGRTEQGEALVKAPKTGTESIYYRYLLERKETDSDGNTSWRTERNETRATDFYLVDETGRALVKVRADARRVTFSVAEKYRQQAGEFRHTEWRIDPGDQVTLFGWLSHVPEPRVDFSTYGQYQPIISSFTGGDERSRIAFVAILWLWAGVSGLIFACYALTVTFRIHRTLVFLIIVSLAGGLMMINYGYRSVVSDVTNGFKRAETHWQRADTLIRSKLVANGLLPIGLVSPFDLSSLAYGELNDSDKRQIDAWRLSAHEVRGRYVQQIARFPDSLVASNQGMTEPSAVALPASLTTKAAGLMNQYQTTRLSDSVPVTWLFLGLLLATAGFAWFSFCSIKVKRMQENIPTSKTEGVVFGLAEVKGTLVADEDKQLLTGPVSGEPCSWYHHIVQEKRHSGKKTQWVTITDEIKKQPFYCEDDEGRIRVFPGQAECISRHKETERSGNRRYTEWRLSPGDDLYVIGKATLDRTRGDSLVFHHEKGSPFIIANISEEEIMFRKAMLGMGLLSIALSTLFLGALFLTGGNGQLSSLDFLLASLVAPIFMLFVVLMLMYNDLVFLRERCDRNWANIQVSLKKRATLVPQIEQVVKEYLSFEKSLQEQLVKLRTRRASIESAVDTDEYLALEHASISRINAQIEAYPDLKGIDLIAVLNRRLIKLENEASLMRAGFNDAVTQYQIRRQTFPDNLLAGMFSFSDRDLLRYTENAHQVPNVAKLVAQNNQ